MSEDAGIEPRTVATLVLNTRLDPIHILSYLEMRWGGGGEEKQEKPMFIRPLIL